MKDTQIPKLTGVIVEHQAAFQALLTPEDAQAAIRDPRGFIETACESWRNRSRKAATLDVQLAEWHRFYSEFFGYPADDSMSFALPAETPGFNWLVVVRKGLTLNKVLEVMRTKMKVYSYIGDDLDGGVPTNERTADKNYAVIIRDRIEADEENKNLSANQIASEMDESKKIHGMTLLERLVLELFYFWKKQNEGEIDPKKMHLDIKNVTLCTGSRRSDGRVPGVDWDSDHGQVYIGWDSVDSSRGPLRARAVQQAVG